MDVANDKNTIVHIINAQSDDINLLTATVLTSDILLPTENEFIVKQACDYFHKVAFLRIDHINSEFYASLSALLVRKSTIDKATQIVVLASRRKHIVHLSHNPPIAGQPDERRMYDTLRSKFFWP